MHNVHLSWFATFRWARLPCPFYLRPRRNQDVQSNLATELVRIVIIIVIIFARIISAMMNRENVIFGPATAILGTAAAVVDWYVICVDCFLSHYLSPPLFLWAINWGASFCLSWFRPLTLKVCWPNVSVALCIRLFVACQLRGSDDEAGRYPTWYWAPTGQRDGTTNKTMWRWQRWRKQLKRAEKKYVTL